MIRALLALALGGCAATMDPSSARYGFNYGAMCDFAHARLAEAGHQVRRAESQRHVHRVQHPDSEPFMRFEQGGRGIDFVRTEDDRILVLQARIPASYIWQPDRSRAHLLRRLGFAPTSSALVNGFCDLVEVHFHFDGDALTDVWIDVPIGY